MLIGASATERLSSLYNDNSHKNKAFSFNNANGDSDWTGSFKFSELLSALTTDKEADMDKYACSEILLCMEAYYKVLIPRCYTRFNRLRGFRLQ